MSISNIDQINISYIIYRNNIIQDISIQIVENIINQSLFMYYSRLKIIKFIKKNYWNWKEKYEKKLMHPRSETFKMFCQDKYF